MAKDEKKPAKAKKKRCFVAGPIGEPGSAIRKWSDVVVDHIITPAAEACGYAKPVRADRIGRPGQITVDIIRHLMNDDLVVADLTDRNPNVYYELAVRHAAGKPCVHIVREGDSLPFDAKDVRAIPVGIEIDKATKAIADLKQHMQAAETQKDKPDNLISFVATIDLMQASGDANQKTVADILEAIQQLGNKLPQPRLESTLTVTPFEGKKIDVTRALNEAWAGRVWQIVWKQDETGVVSVPSGELSLAERYAMERICMHYGVRLTVAQEPF